MILQRLIMRISIFSKLTASNQQTNSNSTMPGNFFPPPKQSASRIITLDIRLILDRSGYNRHNFKLAVDETYTIRQLARAIGEVRQIFRKYLNLAFRNEMRSVIRVKLIGMTSVFLRNCILEVTTVIRQNITLNIYSIYSCQVV